MTDAAETPAAPDPDAVHPHDGDKVAGGRWKRNILIFDALLIVLLGWLLLDMITEKKAEIEGTHRKSGAPPTEPE